MARQVSLAHSKSILDRQRHVMSIGLENQALMHYDINVNDALDRYLDLNTILDPDKWELTGGTTNNIEIQNDGSILITGITGTFTLLSKDFIEINPNSKFSLIINLLNINDNAVSNRVTVGTVNYTDLNTKIPQGRPSGVDYDKWCINNEAIPYGGPDILNWQLYNNKALIDVSGYRYKTGESSYQGDIEKWPTDTKYARIFIQFDNLTPDMQFGIRQLQMFFRDVNLIDNELTPKTYLIDPNDGNFGGAVELADIMTNMVWNGDLKYETEAWSVGTSGSGSVIVEQDDDGSFKVYFDNIQNIKNIIQIDMPNGLSPNKSYTLSFYARSTAPIGFRRINVINPLTETVGWEADEITYLNNVWRKIVVNGISKATATNSMDRLVITEPDLLEAETLFIYYNGVLLKRGDDFTELNDNKIEFEFQPGANDIINILSKSASSYDTTAYRVTFNDPVPAGNKVQIRHFVDISTGAATSVAAEEMYKIVTPVNTIKTGNYVSDPTSRLHVFRNGQLLKETVDYNTALETSVWRINFTYNLLADDIIKVIFWKNAVIDRYEYEAGTGQTDFDLPTGITYIDDKQHLFIFQNGGMLSVDDDYQEYNNNTVRLLYVPSAGDNITIMVLGPNYEYSTDTWELVSPETLFSFTVQEDEDVFRMVLVNGLAMSEDYASNVLDYVTNIFSAGNGFYYERYDYLPAIAAQVTFDVPGGYDPEDDLYIYRNGLLMTDGDDYVTNHFSDSFQLLLPAHAGELITTFRVIYISGTGPGTKQYVREDYIMDESITSYKTSQPYTEGDNSLIVFINGMLQRKGTTYDYVENSDNQTIDIKAPFSSGDKLTVMIAIPTVANTSFYLQETHYGYDVDSNSILDTQYTTNYVEDTTGTVWIKNVKLEEGPPSKDTYVSGRLQTTNLNYNIDTDEREGTLTFYIKPYAIDLIDIIDYQGEVANYASLPGTPSTDNVYRTVDTYEYWKYDGSSWIHIQGPTVLSFTYSTTSQWYWTLCKIERDMNEESKFRAIIGQANDYTIITLPAMQTDAWTSVSMTWSLLGTQWFQAEVATQGDLPGLSVNEDGYVYKVKNTGDYWIWDGGHWAKKAPDGIYAKYADLPTLTVWEDGYVSVVTQEPEKYQTTTYPTLAALEIAVTGHTSAQNGWVYKVTDPDPDEFYIWDWDFVNNNGKLRKINVNYYYQWQWNPVSQSGNWNQSNNFKIYINGGSDGTYTKTYRSVSNSPEGLIINKNLFGKMDELRLDSINRDPREIMTWYKSDAPFYPKGFKSIIV